MTEPPDRHDGLVPSSVDSPSWTSTDEASDREPDIETFSQSGFTTDEPSDPHRPSAAPGPPDRSTPESRFSQLASRVAAAKAASRRADFPGPEPHQPEPSSPTAPLHADDTVQPDDRPGESPTTTVAFGSATGSESDADPESDAEAVEVGATGHVVPEAAVADPVVPGGADPAAPGPSAGDVEDGADPEDRGPSYAGADLSAIGAQGGAAAAVVSGSGVSPDSSTLAGSRPGGVLPGAGAAGGGAAGVQPELDELADPDRLRVAVEAVLLVIDTPTSAVTFAQVLGRSVPEIEAALRTLQGEYDDGGRGIDLREVADGWRLYSRDEFAGYVERFVLDGQQARLTQAALETLSVVAYRQPVTRSRISGIRGVSVDAVMRTLLTRGLVEECGADPDTGGGLYRTTRLFLEKLGLRSLDELPSLAPLLPDTSQLDDVELST